MVRKAIIFIITAIAAFSAMAAAPMPTEVMSREVRTLRVGNPDNFMAPPVVRLGTADRLEINFDIIGESHRYLRWRALHCNADWTPSRLMESEYLDGFNESEITDYAYSSNTYVHYVNYRFDFPSSDMRILCGGNYLLQVYPEEAPDAPLLQMRVFVSENRVAAGGIVTPRTDRGFNTEWQQLELEIDGSGGEVRNPYQDIMVAVVQNNRPESTRLLSHPSRVDGGKIIFSHEPRLIFKAGNEYRRFETVRTDYPGMHVDSVKFGGSNWHAWLTHDAMRGDGSHSYDRTQHGRFKVAEYNSTDSDLGADYVTVHFTLAAPGLAGKEIYVDGDFTNHRFDGFNRMTYDPSTGMHTAEIPLKQGSYNYRYVVAPQRGEEPDGTPVEGDYHETENEYLVLVYQREPGSRGDRLVGFVQLMAN